MLKLEDVMASTDARILEEARKLVLYSNSPRPIFNKRNSIHLTLNFGSQLWVSGDSLPRMSAALIVFFHELYRVAGVKPHKAAHLGWMFVRGRSGIIHPHVHALVYSVKDRRTGATVGRMNAAQIEKLKAIWTDLSKWGRSRGDALRHRHVYDTSHLFSYITGRSNMGAPHQRWVKISAHNLELINRWLDKAA